MSRKKKSKEGKLLVFSGKEKKFDVENYLCENEHSADNFKRMFKFYIENNNGKKTLGELRRIVQKQTFKVIRDLKYFVKGKEIALCSGVKTLQKQIEDAVLFTSDELKNILPCKTGNSKVVVRVLNEDCLHCALKMIERGFNPAVLNMACSTNPGGGFRGGSGAQEENLFRRTTSFNVFYNPHKFEAKKIVRYSKKVPLPLFGGVLSKNVLVFRGSESDGYPFLKKPECVDIIAVAALKNPKRKEMNNGFFKDLGYSTIVGDEMFVPKTEKITIEKIRTVFKIAKSRGNDALCLSAFGCGSYRNPTFHVAHCIKVVIEEFKHDFKLVEIAIIEDHNSPNCGNLKPFLAVFDDLKEVESEKKREKGQGGKEKRDFTE